MNADDITRAVVSGNYLDFYWATKRHPPQQVWQILSELDMAVGMAFITGLVNEWYRLRATLDAANEVACTCIEMAPFYHWGARM